MCQLTFNSNDYFKNMAYFYLRRGFNLLIKFWSFKAGPNLRPMYFIIVSEFSNNKAFPSIS